MNTLHRCTLAAGLGLLGFLSPRLSHAQVPYPASGTPISKPFALIANGGDVKVTFQANTATYDDYLFLFAPSSGASFQIHPRIANYIFWNHDPSLTAGSSTVDLGIFPAGTELVFGEYVRNTGQTFYSGLGSRNADGDVHAYVTSTGPTKVFVGFEDLLASSSDFNYNDITFTMDNLSAVEVPEPGLLALLLGAVLAGGLRTLGRRGAQSNAARSTPV